MKFSIRKKTAAYCLILFILAFAMGLGFCAMFATRYYVGIITQEMINANNIIRQMYDEESDLNTGFGSVPREYYRELTEICEKNAFSMLVVSPSGSTAFSYGNADILYQRLNNLTFLRENTGNNIIEYGDNYTIQTVNGADGSIAYLEMWGFFNDGCSFIFRCSYSGVQNHITVTLSFFLAVTGIMFIIFGIILLMMLRTFTEPLKRLAQITVKVNEGDFDLTFDKERKRNDEIGVLSENVSEMARKLEQTIRELKTSNLNLKNELKAKDEIEEARKKYMSDVSHELKTPIALISGYAEGLKEGIFESKEDQDYYCDVIIDEAEKMNLMIKKLSALNQLEQGKSAVNLERFNVVEVIDGFLRNMIVIIEESGANIFFNSTDVAYVWSDEFLFEDVMVNYFNNALHHMDERKIIRINVEKIEEHIRVTVFNSGQNIPEEELDKLWGKFYKVDKARTREYGGSGLGLSIVKAIADSLDQKCGVYNLPDGVAFYFELETAESSSNSSNLHTDKKQAGRKKHTASGEPAENKTIDNSDNLKQEKHSHLKLSEIPLWKGLKDKITRKSENTDERSDKET